MLCGSETKSEVFCLSQANLKSIIGLLSEELTASNDQMVELSSSFLFCGLWLSVSSEKLETACKIKQGKVLFLDITSGEHRNPWRFYHSLDC